MTPPAREQVRMEQLEAEAAEAHGAAARLKALRDEHAVALELLGEKEEKLEEQARLLQERGVAH